MSRFQRFGLLAVALVASLAGISTLRLHHPAGAVPGHSHLPAYHYHGKRVGPKGIYLALGDSLAFGYQPGRDWGHSYADDWFAQDLQAEGVTRLEDYGCPGETLDTFMGRGNCPFRFLRKVHYPGAQLNAALAFIRQHKGDVSPVTLDIGANDFLHYFSPAACRIKTPTDGINATLARFDANFTAVLSQLKAALAGTGDLFVMNYYFPLQNKCYAMLGGNSPAWRSMMALVQRLNAHLTRDATALGIPVADVFDAYGGATTPNARLCANTWMCSGKSVWKAIHPTDAGYQVIYKTFHGLAGY